MENSVLFVTKDSVSYAVWERDCKAEWSSLRPATSLSCRRLNSVHDAMVEMYKGDPARIRLVVIDVDGLPEVVNADPKLAGKTEDARRQLGIDILNLFGRGPYHEVRRAGEGSFSGYVIVVGTIFSRKLAFAEAISGFVPKSKRIIRVNISKAEAGLIILQYLVLSSHTTV